MIRPNILRINPLIPENDIIQAAADILNREGVVVVPTETRYGLAVRADRANQVQKVYDIKGRSTKNPSAIFIKNTGCISDYAIETDVSKKLAAKFLPGAMTLVLKAREDRPHPAAFEGKIGLRVSSSKVIADLLDSLSFDLTATSANRSGLADAETVDDIAVEFGGEVDLYLDAGKLDGPVSTVVDCSGDKAVVLREGAISREDIAGEVPV